MKCLIIIFLLTACSPTISTDTDKPLIQRLKNTSWKIMDPARKHTIVFSKDTVKLRISSILGAAPTGFHIYTETNNFVLLNVFSDIDSQFLALELVNNKTLRMLIWQDTGELIETHSALELTKNEGILFQLYK